MVAAYRIEITNERRTQRNRVLEFDAYSPENDEPFLAIATLYGSDLYINLPANPEANGFIRWLSERVGVPVETPTVKCSAQWSEIMIGPMQTVAWKLGSEELKKFDEVFVATRGEGKNR
jgi:hypothetical protein